MHPLKLYIITFYHFPIEEFPQTIHVDLFKYTFLCQCPDLEASIFNPIKQSYFKPNC